MIGFAMTDLPLDDETLEQCLDEFEGRKSRIRKQSAEVASYISSNEEFYEWFDEIEGFALREERFWDDCQRAKPEELFEWVRWAFHIGYLAGKGDLQEGFTGDNKNYVDVVDEKL